MIGLSFLLAEFVYESFLHLDLFNKWGLLFTLETAAMTISVRFWAEVGRIVGQIERGTLYSNLFCRFNWYGRDWPDWPHQQRLRCFKRGLFRIVFTMLVLNYMKIAVIY